MDNMIRKGFLIGLGLAATSKEKMTQYMEKMQAGDPVPDEWKEWMDTLTQKGQEQENIFNEQTNDQISKWLSELGFVTEERVTALEVRLAELEKALAEANTEKNE